MRILFNVVFLFLMSQYLIAQDTMSKSHFSIMSDQMWSKNQYRLIVVKSDSSFSFTKNDEPLIDYISGKWLQKNDSFFFFSNDTFRILYFTILQEDSIHRKMLHINPSIYDSYHGTFPTFLYLTKTFYSNGALHKEFDFIQKGDLSDEPEQLKIQCFSEKGSIQYSLTIQLRSNEAVYVEYLQNERVYPKEIVYGTYKNGVKKGLWYFNEFDITGTKKMKTTKILY